jgi:pyocin large subunit-like protein
LEDVMIGKTMRSAWTAAAALALLAATGCGNGGSAVETRDRAAEGAEAVLAPAAAAEASGPEAARTKPALTANRRETVDAKVTRLFERNGADFGAASAEDYLAKVQAFTTRPPAGVERVERPNGDVLLYQASTNTFAVVSRDGVAKTMFKPRDGLAYWTEQKAAAPEFGRRRSPASAD